MKLTVEIDVPNYNDNIKDFELCLEVAIRAITCDVLTDAEILETHVTGE